MMRIIAPWFANAGEMSAKTPSLIGVPLAGLAAAGTAAKGAEVADVGTDVGAATAAVGAAGFGGVVGAAGGVLLHAVATAMTIASPNRAARCESL
jgi:hypothetical protein